MRLDPKDPSPHLHLGDVLFRRERYADAAAEYRECLDRRPKALDAVVAHSNRGNALNALGDADGAIEEYRNALRLDPNHANSHTNLARALASRGQFGEAIEAYENALRTAPNQRFALNELAWLRATCSDESLRNPGEAVRLASRAVDLARDDGGAWNTLGVAKYRTGDWKGCVEALDESARLRDGGHLDDWLFLAMAHERLGDHASAATWLDRATSFTRDHPPSEEDQRFLDEARGVVSPR
jgi:tetratricopeptide (TPR) repeat protein